MSIRIFGILVLVSTLISGVAFAAAPVVDVIEGPAGKLTVTMIGHGSIMLESDGKVTHVDPFGRIGAYDKLPKADLILITHDHGDHLDPQAIAKIRTDNTIVVASDRAANKAGADAVMKNGDVRTEAGIKIEAVPAYNIRHMRESGKPFHPKGKGNGYVLTTAGLRIYVAGDTERIPEMEDLKSIDVAFLPMNLPYTMTAAMAADAVKIIKPAYLFPYHYAMGVSQLPHFLKLMKDIPDVEIRGLANSDE